MQLFPWEWGGRREPVQVFRGVSRHTPPPRDSLAPPAGRAEAGARVERRWVIWAHSMPQGGLQRICGWVPWGWPLSHLPTEWGGDAFPTGAIATPRLGPEPGRRRCPDTLPGGSSSAHITKSWRESPMLPSLA